MKNARRRSGWRISCHWLQVHAFCAVLPMYPGLLATLLYARKHMSTCNTTVTALSLHTNAGRIIVAALLVSLTCVVHGEHATHRLRYRHSVHKPSEQYGGQIRNATVHHAYMIVKYVTSLDRPLITIATERVDRHPDTVYIARLLHASIILARKGASCVKAKPGSHIDLWLNTPTVSSVRNFPVTVALPALCVNPPGCTHGGKNSVFLA